MAVGGAEYLVAQAIKSAQVHGFPELGMEAIYEFEVEDMPVTVAVDSRGESVHETGPKIWRAHIEENIEEAVLTVSDQPEVTAEQVPVRNRRRPWVALRVQVR